MEGQAFHTSRLGLELGQHGGSFGLGGRERRGRRMTLQSFEPPCGFTRGFSASYLNLRASHPTSHKFNHQTMPSIAMIPSFPAPKVTFSILALLLLIQVPDVETLQSSATQRTWTPTYSRRNYLERVIGGTMITVTLANPSLAIADDPIAALRSATDQACQSLTEALDRSDYETILNLTKEYDAQLRKGGMGRIKKTMTVLKDGDPTALANSVTFDLIGINKSARKGVENPEQMRRYIAELRADVDEFLAMYQ